MILTAHQPVYLPWLGLFHKIALADLFVSFDQVQYQPEEWNNRNRVKTASGPSWLTVPVQRKGYLRKKITNIEIDDCGPWRRKHWNTLKLNYGKTPHFRDYADFFEDAYSRDWDSLVALNDFMLRWFLDTLGISTPVRSAGEWDFQGEKSALVLDMCRQTGASVFIFGALGRDYADLAAFGQAGIRPVFQDYRHPEYPQLHGAFEANLSVVDLLFNCGADSLDILMSGNLDRAGLAPQAA